MQFTIYCLEAPVKSRGQKGPFEKWTLYRGQGQCCRYYLRRICRLVVTGTSRYNWYCSIVYYPFLDLKEHRRQTKDCHTPQSD